MSLIDTLLTRRSVPVTALEEPGPSAEELGLILAAASRVPDHGRLAPFRFILFEGDARIEASLALGRIYARERPEASEAMKAAVSRVLAHAPLVVAVVSRAGEHPKIPEWEQVLTTGAVCMNMIAAANALGYGTQWLTGFSAYEPAAQRLLGLEPGERHAGFIHIGTARERPADRERPDLAAIVTRWAPPRGAEPDVL